LKNVAFVLTAIIEQPTTTIKVAAKTTDANLNLLDIHANPE
jgi:hypothetical protein